MQSTSSEAQITCSGQAIAINNLTCIQLSELFSPMLGPHGSVKALVNGGQELSLTKDGEAVCRDLQFVHPTSILITRAASSLYAANGDGTITFVLLTTETFAEAYKFYCDGTTLPLIINSLQLALRDIGNYLQENTVPLTDETLRKLAYTSLRTKLKNPEPLVDITLKALLGLSASKSLDTNMIEILKMEEGEIADSVFVDGLVLDHSGRHYAMPTELENACTIAMNMSLEYEKPEITAEFCYSSASQRDMLAKTEREYVLEKAKKIADLAEELKKDGRSLVVINEKGIDQFSLEILSKAGVIALRRAKRRNLERLINMCGGRIVTEALQVTKDCLGFCQKVFVKSVGENKYTFIEGTPFKGACTVVLRGNIDYKRASRSIKGTINSLASAIQNKHCIYGGIPMYRNIIKHLENRASEMHECDVSGYRILSRGFESLIKILLRNEGKNIHESLAGIFRESGVDKSIVENIRVVGGAINNAVIMAINLLMCDEIIKAGRPIKQEKMQPQ